MNDLSRVELGLLMDGDLFVSGEFGGQPFQLTIDADGARLLAEAVIDLLDNTEPLVSN